MTRDHHPGEGLDPITDVPGPPSPAESPSPASQQRGLRGLPRRTVAICHCLATIGALLAALVATTIVDGSKTSGSVPQAELEPIGEVDIDRLLSVALTTVDGQPTTLAAHLDQRHLRLCQTKNRALPGFRGHARFPPRSNNAGEER